jgi:hypothetical protein
MGIIGDYITARKRPLTGEEISDARRVYQGTIMYPLVAIADDLGARQAEWTEPTGGAMNAYIVHMGPLGYASTLDPDRRQTLIHELCHVWQGSHHVFAWGYVINSVIHQAASGAGAYSYDPANLRPWGEYNVEQQAKIVEDWYAGGLSTASPLYRYIVGNIRCPVKSWFKENMDEIVDMAVQI